jgi:hypothetical protein
VNLPSRLSVIIRDFYFYADQNGPLVKAVTNAIVRAECSMRQAAKAERWDSTALWAGWSKEFIKSIDTFNSGQTAPDGGYDGPRHWEHGRSCVEEMVGACGRALYENFPNVDVLRTLHLTLRRVTEVLSSDIYLCHLKRHDASLPIRKWRTEVLSFPDEVADEPGAVFTAFVLSRFLDVSERIENERWEHLRRISTTDEPEPCDQAPSMTGEPEADSPASALAIPEAAIPPLPAREQTDTARADSRGSPESAQPQSATVSDLSEPKPTAHPIPPEATHAATIQSGGFARRKERVVPRSEYRVWLQKLKSLALLGWRYRRRSVIPNVSALQKLHVDAMDLLLGIGPPVSGIREVRI